MQEQPELVVSFSNSSIRMIALVFIHEAFILLLAARDFLFGSESKCQK